MFIPILTEVAWAAGFFDGEGTFGCHGGQPSRLKAGRISKYLGMSVNQVDAFVLERFKKAVGGLGSVGGPYIIKKENRKPIYSWRATNFEEIQATIAILWKYLSPVKKAQIKNAISAYHENKIVPKYKKCISSKHNVSIKHKICRTCYNAKINLKKGNPVDWKYKYVVCEEAGHNVVEYIFKSNLNKPRKHCLTCSCERQRARAKEKQLRIN